MSKKIGRNDPCPCGSGKKYKYCHLFATEPTPMSFNDLLASHNSVQILRLLGALQLHPENQGRIFRFEQLCRETLLRFNQDDEKPLADWEKLREVIENYREGKSYEDPLSNAFTEIVIFEQGNYIVYPGIYNGFTRILNQLIECIFLSKNSLNVDFLKHVRDAIGLLLFMSEKVARDAGHIPYIYQNGNTRDIEFPNISTTDQYINAIYFPRTYLEKVCAQYKYDIAVLDEFILQPGSIEIQNEDPENNVVYLKPFTALEDAVILYMPNAILYAVITFIYQKAVDYNCNDEVLELLYARQFHLSRKLLASIGWIETDIELPSNSDQLAVLESVFQFDNQKLAYLCYLKNAIPQKKKIDRADKSVDPLQKRCNEVVQLLSKIEPRQPFNIFCLYIIGETSRDYYFMQPKTSTGHQTLTVTYSELWTITHSSNVNSLTLWKFAKSYNRAKELTGFITIGGALDAYAIYQKNEGSILNSDEVNPTGGIFMIANGSSDDFRREVQKQQNEHAVAIFYEGKRGYAKVVRFKDYAPIYIEKEVSTFFRIVIESYKMPIWITNPQTKVDKESLERIVVKPLLSG